MYGEGRFAKHPRFRYFALNTEMRWLASSVQTRKTEVPVAARQFPTTLPSLTGFFTTASASLWTRSTLMSWEQLTSGTGLSGSTEEVPMCMALHSLLMLLMSRVCLQLRTTLISSEVWRMSQATLTELSAPSTLPFRWTEATQRMLPCHKPSLTCATSLTQRWKTSRWT